MLSSLTIAYSPKLTTLLFSPSTFAYLAGSYIVIKILRSWFRRCLPSNTDTTSSGGGSGGGGEGPRRRRRRTTTTSSIISRAHHTTLGDDDDENETTTVNVDVDLSAQLRTLSIATNSNLIVPNIKLVPLDNDVSVELDRVMMTMTDNDSHTNDGGGKEPRNPELEMSMEMEEPPPAAEETDGRGKISEHDAMEVDHDGNDSMIMEDEPNHLAGDKEDNDINGDQASSSPAAAAGAGGGGTKNAIEQMIENSFTSYSLDCYPYTFSPLLLFTNSGYFDKGYSNYNAVAAFFAPALRELGAGSGSNSGNGDGGGDGRGDVGAESNNWTKVEGRNGRREQRKNGNSSDATADATSASATSNAMDTKDDSYDDGGFNMLHSVIYDRKNLTYDELFNHIVATQSIVTCCIDAHFTAFQMLNKQTLLYYDPLNPHLMVAKSERDVHLVALYLLMKCHYGDNAHIHENEKYYTAPTSSRLQNQV